MLPWVALCLAKRSCRQRGRPTKPPPSKNDALSEHEVFRLARDRVARAMVRTTCLLVYRESAPFLLLFLRTLVAIARWSAKDLRSGSSRLGARRQQSGMRIVLRNPQA
jgi:hypothetical protein